MNPQGRFTYFVLRPLSDLFLWTWRLERRFEFLYRARFDCWFRGPLFELLQWVQNLFRRNQHLPLATETPLPDEDELTRAIITEISAFTRENWLPGGAQRFGNTKTFGVTRGEFSVSSDLPDALRRGCSPSHGPSPLGCGSRDPDRTHLPTWKTSVSARSGSR